MGFPNMNFLGSLSGNLNPFIEKMDKGELTLEDILNEDNIIQDIKNNNDSKFINFLTSEKIKKLIDYSTKFPSQDEHNIGYKYPFNATEILCSENTNIQNVLMEEKPYKTTENESDVIKKIKKRGGFIIEIFKAINNRKEINKNENKEKEQESDNESDEEEEEENEIEETNVIKDKNEEKNKVIYDNVDYLLNFLKETDRTNENYVLVGYFYKILNNLINIHQIKIVQYLLDYPKKKEFDIINLLIKHMNRKSICNIIQKLLIFDDELISKLNEKKVDFFSEILNELDKTDEKNKYECICDCICNVISNRQFFDLIMTKNELLEKIYDILCNYKNNNNKYNSIMKLLIKINENILQHFSVRFTDNNNENNNNNDVMPFNIDTGGSMDRSLSSPEDNLDILKKYILALFDTIEKNKFSCFDDYIYNNDKNKGDDEFMSTYMEKQKKIGIKKILQTEYLKTFIDILVNSYASKYHESKIEQLIKITIEKNIFWNMHDLFLNFPFSNIFQIYYFQIMKIVLYENSPNCLIDAFFTEIIIPKRNLIEVYIDKILSDMKFIFKLTNTPSFNPIYSYIISILNKIFTSSNLYVKTIIEKNKDISVFHEVLIQEIQDIFNQKLLLNDNNIGGFGFDTIEEEVPLKTFGPLNFMQVFEENCKIYELYKKGEDYQKVLKEKKEKKEKEKSEVKKDNRKEKKGLGSEYIDDLEEDDDPLFKVEKINLNKEKENFLAMLNKPTEELNNEEENKDIIIDNENEGELKTEYIGRFKELWNEEDDNKEKNNENKEKINENEKDKNINSGDEKDKKQ